MKNKKFISKNNLILIIFVLSLLVTLILSITFISIGYEGWKIAFDNFKDANNGKFAPSPTLFIYGLFLISLFALLLLAFIFWTNSTFNKKYKNFKNV